MGAVPRSPVRLPPLWTGLSLCGVGNSRGNGAIGAELRKTALGRSYKRISSVFLLRLAQLDA